jgi:hypothetical protein
MREGKAIINWYDMCDAISGVDDHSCGNTCDGRAA